MQTPSLHWAFDPQGDGLHLSIGGGGSSIKLYYICFSQIYTSHVFFIYNGLIIFTLWRNWAATAKRITCVPIKASTDRRVIDYITDGITSARAWARIDTFVTYAGLIARAVGINCAFRSTARRRSKVVWQTRARWHAVSILTLSIEPTWRWYTWIGWLSWCILWSCIHRILFEYEYNCDFLNLISRQANSLTGNGVATCEWISCKSISTRADGTVVVNTTLCVRATHSRTGIYAFLIETSFVTGTLGANNTFWSTSRRIPNVFGQT